MHIHTPKPIHADTHICNVCVQTKIMSTFVNLSFPVINYEITVVTGDVTFAGTNATVFIQIYGDKGKTEIIKLESRSNNFERNTTEIFKVLKLGF